MAPTVLVVATGHARDELASQLGPAAVPFAASFLADTVAVARSLSGTQVLVRYSPRFPLTALAAIAPELNVAPIGDVGGTGLSAALAEAMAEGEPALLIGADLPHLPPWRLRDALTHLAYGADVVVGPSDQGDWYLLGLRAPVPELLQCIPARGESAEGLLGAATELGLRLAILPAWFAVRTGGGLADLAEALRPMPPGIATQTRALLDAEMGSARAVGG